MPKTSSPTLPASSRRMLATPPRLELLHAMQRQPHGVLEDPLADGHLQQLGDARGVPAAPDVNGQFDERDDEHGRAIIASKQRPAAARGAKSGSRAGSGLSLEHVVDDELRGGRRHQRQQRRDGQREQREG